MHKESFHLCGITFRKETGFIRKGPSQAWHVAPLYLPPDPSTVSNRTSSTMTVTSVERSRMSHMNRSSSAVLDYSAMFK